MSKITNDQLTDAANTIRGLSMDGVQQANSGHPGMPMGMADVAAVLWLKHLDYCPAKPDWPNRDRFVLSAGHGSMLIYSLLHLAGFDLPLTELEKFRQWESRTPGHPEYGETEGVETTTGPLGQGCGNAVGMAVAEAMLAERYNQDDSTLVDHYTYVIAGDGDMMEGISHEAFSLAGHLKLGKLVVFYDSNQITIEGATDLAYSDDVKRRFQGYQWQVIDIDAHDCDQIDRAIRRAKRQTDAPTLIIARSSIGKGSPAKEGKASAHGEPLGAEEVLASKRNLGLPEDKPFYVPDAVRELFAKRAAAGKRKANKWQKLFSTFAEANPEKAKAWNDAASLALPEDFEAQMPEFDLEKAVATRAASGKVIQKIAASVPYFVGGSADLAPSTKTLIDDGGDIAPGSFGGRNFHFGIREHAMASMLNGIALHGGLRAFGATFFVFLDYCKPSVRLAALMKLPVIYVFTHDSFYVGEDGPTHEPIEQLAMLRATPGMTTIRPAEATETAAAWIAAMKHTDGPTALILTRQNLKVIDRATYPAASNVEKGAYTLWQSGEGTPDVILIGTGSEVQLAMTAAEQLAGEMNIRVVSMPSWELFDKQDPAYRDSVLPPTCRRRLAIEAGSSMGWSRYVTDDGCMICMDRFGASAPYQKLEEAFGYTVENVVSVVRHMR